MNKKSMKLSLNALILMIFTSVFGFANIPRSFYLMGYAAVPWYIISAIVFFIPYAFIMAEYGSAFKKESGGMYSWMEKAVGAKYAFVGTFMWYASYIVWMVNVSSTIWIPLSNAIFGSDKTSSWAIFGLNSTEVLGILGALWIIFVTFIAIKGVERITKITSIGGTFVAILNVVLIIGAILVVILNSGEFAEPINNIINTFTISPNPDYKSIIQILSFITFAIFAFGGLEVLGGLVDQTKDAERTFPKAIIIAATIISIGYAIGIFACGMFTNWNNILSGDNVNLSNVAYILMNNLGVQIGYAIGLSESASIQMGLWVARFVGISMLLALTGAFFTLTYSPLKTLLSGAPKEVWPGKLGEIKNDMPVKGMYVQGIIVIIIILLVSFGGKGAKEFFRILVLMTNVAMTIPYLFLAAAFPKFKKKQLEGKVDKAYMFYKTYGSAVFVSIMICLMVGFANIFTIIEPAISGKISDTIIMIAGPISFSIIALILFSLYEKKK
ncbi:glutamate/gamma-aminobutyrate family transporter YjeM [uncultured Clostridium sp.]|uniref:glutamate/gamma-aminobutyrate family transporter YjeM n=1 Tax=uncultured Clostridium sp. TaxID=59620 RepID=UPI0025EE545C|nr:glutamate/gamma-aminobutyrate family transporter YjeM [uncultured Clostridium sp.]